MELIYTKKHDPTAVDALSYIDEDEGLTAASSEMDFGSDGNPFAYEDRLHAAIDLRQAVMKNGTPINDDNINQVLQAAGVDHASVDDINRLVAIL
jgi:hypothetical protein